MYQQLILQELKKHFSEARSDLYYDSPWQLFAAVILSAQCTDKRVNIVTDTLFKMYPTVRDYLTLDYGSLETIIASTGFYRNKARHIIDAAHIIVDTFNGEVPLTMKELLSLPGIGRKSANVIMTVYAEPEGIVVDTHVIRIAERLLLSKSKDPGIIEHDLVNYFDRKDWPYINQALVLFGRYICKARNPECDNCSLQRMCKLHGAV